MIFLHFLKFSIVLNLVVILVEAYKRELIVDWDQFYPMLQEILKRVPSLKQVELESLVNAPETFSPDCKWIVGETPEVTIILSSEMIDANE